MVVKCVLKEIDRKNNNILLDFDSTNRKNRKHFQNKNLLDFHRHH